MWNSLVVDSEESLKPMGSAVVLRIVEERGQTGHLGLPVVWESLVLTVRNQRNRRILWSRSTSWRSLAELTASDCPFVWEFKSAASRELRMLSELEPRDKSECLP